MQSLAAFFEDNKPLAYAATVAALLVLIMVVFVLYRMLFGRRLRTATSGRARQPRLGIVDAYDLDRQRQLVLVRRDNVEHLIMIGGPTDVVIESAIVRTQTQGVVREKDGAGPLVGPLTPPLPALGQQAPSFAAATQSPSLAPPLPARTEPSLAIPIPLPVQNGMGDRTAARPQPDGPPSGGSGSAPAPSSDPPIPPIRSAQPSNAQAAPRPSSLPPRPAPAQAPGAAALAPNPNAGAPGGPGPARPPLPTRPAPRPPLPPRPSLASSLPPRPPRPPLPPRTDPSPPPRSDAPATPVNEGPASTGSTPQTAGPAVEPEPRVIRGSAEPAAPRQDAGQPSVAPTKGVESLESLEEEMAKLLGRPAPRREG